MKAFLQFLCRRMGLVSASRWLHAVELNRGLVAQLRRPFELDLHEEPPPWSEADTAAWRTFLRTDTGERLRSAMSYYEQIGNRMAVMRSGQIEYNAGSAAGFHRAIAWLEKLSANVPPHTDDDSEERQGATAHAERLAP